MSDAQALRDKLIRDLEGRSGFHRDGMNKETKAEWNETWLRYITAALDAREREVWEKAARAVESLMGKDSGNWNRAIIYAAEACRRQGGEA